MLATLDEFFARIPVAVYIAVVAGLLVWVLVYFGYRVLMTRIKDFGLPIRRRILCRRLRVLDDERAEVPFWWTDLQVQRAVRSHWRGMLRSPFAPPRQTPAR